MAYATLAQFKAYQKIINGCAFTADAATDKLTLAGVQLAHDLVAGAEVEVESTNTLPGGLSADTIYYIILDVDQLIKLAATSALAAAGTAIDITSAGTGPHTLYRAVRDDDLLSDLLDRITKRIEARCGGRVFEAVSASRYFDSDALGEDGYTLYVDEDLVSVTTLKNGDADATVIADTEYWLVPRNQGPPYHGLRLKVDSDHSWEWGTDGWVEVAGDWGWSATPPADVVQACLEWAAYAYQLKDSQVFDVTAFPESGVIMIPKGIPAHVREALEPYIRLVY